MANILSVSSAVAYGFVGNSVAVPALQAMGHTVWRVDTVTLSNHPGHGQFRGQIRGPDDLDEILTGLADLDLWQQCDGILTGYLGDGGTPEMLAGHIERIRKARPDCIFLCDPVIGDDGRVFVRGGVGEGIRDHLLPLADMATPNLFELAWLTGVSGQDNAVSRLQASGPADICVTGVPLEDQIATVSYTGNAEPTPVKGMLHDRVFKGSGDLLAALILGHRLKGQPTYEATARAMDDLDRVLARTVENGTYELDISPLLSGDSD